MKFILGLRGKYIVLKTYSFRGKNRQKKDREREDMTDE